jgi:hypothetical protein
MNTLNFEPFEFDPESAFDIIWKLHGELVLRYNSFEPNKVCNFDINTYQDQQILKDFLQIRFIEELTEAYEDFENRDHLLEELTDAFNFLVAAYIIYGYTPSDLEEWQDMPDYYGNDKEFFAKDFWDIVQSVGECCNHLKNRPWRQSQYFVDLYSFEPKFKKIMTKFNMLCNMLNISKKQIFEQWSLKYQVNKFRLDSNY